MGNKQLYNTCSDCFVVAVVVVIIIIFLLLLLMLMLSLIVAFPRAVNK